MHVFPRIRAFLLFGASIVALYSVRTAAQTNPSDGKPGSQEVAKEHDGQHDFDFEMGTWKSQISRRVHPLTGSDTWAPMEATVTFRKIWNGRANLMELRAERPNGRFEELNLRLYDPQSHQWTFNFANSGEGTMAKPMVGEFRDGRGEFVGQDSFHDRTILVRHVFSDITPDSHHFEQSFSDDGGKTWEPNFVATLTRVKEEAPAAQESSHSSTTSGQPSERDGQHDFDFNIGNWKTHQRRLLRPLTGSTTWVDYYGTDVVRPIWSGANLGEIEADGSAGHLELLSLRLYNPQAHQWSFIVGSNGSGTLSPMIGEFKNGRAEFIDQEPYNGRTILVRFTVSNITANSCRFEQSFSDDGGKTWELNFIVTESREKDGSH